MFISIIIPAYNRKESLEIVLKKLEEQDFDKNFEVIVIDDWSTDWTKDFLKKI